MHRALVITPVKDALANTLDTCLAISKAETEIKHLLFNDFSSPETKSALEKEKNKIGFELIHLEEFTQKPSPNYKLALQMAQKRALESGLPMIIIESDVVIKPDTISRLLDFATANKDLGLLGAITVDESGKVNFPYLKFKHLKGSIHPTERSLSFCCTLISKKFLESFDFQELDNSKDWYDTFVSKKSLELGFKNYIMMDNPVWHKPHGSRPWKQLKYENPLKYYFLKFFKGRDKI